MANLVFFNVPGHGHINPSLPLTAELVRRSHRLTYFATPRYATAIAATGATFEAYSSITDTYFDPYVSNGLRPMRVANALLTTASAILPELLDKCRALQPDAILFDCMCPWGYFVARSLKLPAVASFSLIPPAPPGYLLRDRAMLRLMLPLLFRDFATGIEAIRRARALGKQYGVPPLTTTSLLNAEGDLSLSYTSAAFVPYSDSVPESIAFTGWTLNESPAGDPPPITPMTGRPLVYVSLGTIYNNAPEFFRLCIEAFTDSNFAAVISTGGRVEPESLGPVPENIIVRPWVAQTSVLRKASLFVTHGGMGSVHDGLYLGLPLLCVPQQEEETLTALRVAQLGAGVVIKRSDLTANTLRVQAARLVAEPRFAAASQRLGETLLILLKSYSQRAVLALKRTHEWPRRALLPGLYSFRQQKGPPVRAAPPFASTVLLRLSCFDCLAATTYPCRRRRPWAGPGSSPAGP